MKDTLILSDTTLRRMIVKGSLVVKPYDEQSLQPASLDLHLSNSYLKMREDEQAFVSLDSPSRYVSLERNEIIIPPLAFMLASCQEWIELPGDVTAFVEGRSSIGRIGLFVQNAGWVDPGFKGRLTLELFNANHKPIRLTSGRRICQLVFAKMDQVPSAPYHGKYQGQTKATGSMVHQDVEVTSRHPE